MSFDVEQDAGIRKVDQFVWTDEQVSVLKRLYVEGLSASQIAEKLGQGCTRNAVIGKWHRLKLIRESKRERMWKLAASRLR